LEGGEDVIEDVVAGGGGGSGGGVAEHIIRGIVQEGIQVVVVHFSVSLSLCVCM
jgi:hypothetical protein